MDVTGLMANNIITPKIKAEKDSNIVILRFE